ncbi:putative lipoprotein [Leptospira santarosai str. ST188]|nr:putative lipoprotein [Leptospira santarosai str. JET]EMF89277.1 putative lipoprotein [Leptospira santarosai str. ST188]EMO34107.1 putative lipoprotein [Leptospira santarosai str. HAI821]EPG82413.1 putative lipoprotein [Leptospira santarosai serovar Shermani str. 1342KT]
MRRALSSYPTVCLSTQSLSACFDFQNPIKLQEFQDFETGFDTRTFESEIYGSNVT